MSPAGGGENPYVYGGNSPVDRSLGVGRQQMADDFTSSRFDAGYSHYLDPREGWNGNAEDRLFAIGKFAAWGVAIVAGSAAGAITWGAAIAANLANVTFAGVATYAAKNVAVAGIETVGEGLLANAMGDDTFSASGSFARNVGFNLTVGLLPGAAETKAAARTAAVARTLGGRIAGKAAKYGVHYASEVAVGTTFDTAWEVGVNGRNVGDAFTQSLVGNSVGQLLGDGLSAGLSRGLKAAGIQQFGRLCFVAGTIVIRGDGGEQAIERNELGAKVQPRDAAYVELNPPDPATWRKVTLRALNAADADVEIELLRPLSWLESQSAAPGSVVHVEIAELNLDGDARVLSIEPCPPIERGPGAVITGRFSHISNDLVDVWVEGLEEPITGTSRHPFWSVTRQAWAPACELQTGELLEGKSGTAQVVSVSYRDDGQQVYNIEVHDEHNYRASALGVVVHNSSFRDTPFADDEAFQLLAKVRRELNMPVAGSKLDGNTLSLLQIDNRFFVGVNAGIADSDAVASTLQALAAELGHKGPTFQLLRHAEGDSLFQAFNKGVGQGRSGKMWVDREVCPGCKSGLDNMRRLVGLKELNVIVSGSSPQFYPKKRG